MATVLSRCLVWTWSRVEWIKLWQARIRDFEPEMETQGAHADDCMVIIAERSGRVMLHFCSLTLVRTVQGALAQTTFSEQTGRHEGEQGENEKRGCTCH